MELTYLFHGVHVFRSTATQLNKSVTTMFCNALTRVKIVSDSVCGSLCMFEQAYLA
jgi:hypothetical protein